MKRNDERKGVRAIEIAAINGLVEEVRDEVVEWRRHLHRNPELSFEEEETSRFVYETLESFGGLEISRPTETSVLARLVGEDASRGRTIAIRADMDALPIQEETGLPFASKNEGVMHACGHDGHTAILLGAAKILSGMKEDIRGDIRFVFQHAEEKYPGGAQQLVEAGVMGDVDALIGLHLLANREVGKISLAPGPVTAASDTFEIVVRGGGGHVAFPHHTVDPVAVAGQVLASLQHVVPREVDPREAALIAVSRISGGTAHNVVPDKVEMEGSARALSEEVRERLPEAMERIISGVTRAYGASYSFEYQRGYAPVVNDDEVTAAVEEVAREVFGDGAVEAMHPLMNGEDFSAYGRVVPGCFFFVGAGNEEKGITAPHHHPRFDIDEDALEHGLKMFIHAAFGLLETDRDAGG